MSPRRARSAPVRTSPVLETITVVLERAGQPMTTRDIHAAAEDLAGESVLRTSVKAALAACATSTYARFRRIRGGYYEIKKS